MNASYLLKRFYFENNLCIFFGILQVALSLGLFTYLVWDFKMHFRQQGVLVAEVVIFGMMVADFLVWHLSHGFRLTPLSFLEVSLMLGFAACFGAIYVHGVHATNERIEMFLITVRFCLQISRLLVIVMRIRQSNTVTSAAKSLELTGSFATSDNRDANSVNNLDLKL